MSEVFNNNEFTSEPSQQSSNSYPYSFEQPFDAQQQPFAAQPQPSAPVPEQKKKSGKAGKIVALLLACALVGGGSGFGAAALMQKNAAAQPQSTTQTSSDASVMLEAKRQAAALQKVSRLAQLLVGNAAALHHKQGTVTYLGKAESVTAFAQGWSIYQKISKLWCTAFHLSLIHI